MPNKTSQSQTTPDRSGASTLVSRRFGFPLLALLAALAASLLFLLPGGLVQAQDDDVMYAENSMDPVATFTATDPEGRPVYWSLATAAVDGAEVTDDDVADYAYFMISADGVLSFNFSPDYEMPRGMALTDENSNTYNVVAVASDDAPGAGGMIEMAYEKVTVMVTDVDDMGMVTLSAQQPQVGVALMASLMDDDATAEQITEAKWQWEQTSAMDEPWAVILDETAATYTPGEGVIGKYLRATATYTDKHDSDKSEMAVSANKLRASQEGVNSNPVFPSVITRDVPENSPPGTNVDAPVTAADPDGAGEVLTYSFEGEDNVIHEAFFSIDPATGQITVGPQTMLDADGGNSEYMVTVRANDPSVDLSATPLTGTATLAVTITVKDVNEAPTVNLGATRITQMEHDEDLVDTPFDLAVAIGTYGAMDPESVAGACVAASCTWSLKGPDSGDFVIGNVGSEPDFAFGALRFKEAPNYEMPADANGDNMYEVTVVVTDAGVDGKNKMTAERGVVIEVTNVDEDGTVTLSSDHPKVDIELTATLTEDIDGGVTDLTWQWYDGTIEPNDLTSAAIEDATSATYTPAVGDLEDTLTARAAYTDAEGEGKSATMAATMVVIENLDNRPPEFEDADTGTTRYVIETAMEGALVRLNADGTTLGDTGDDPVTATDPNEDGDTSLLAYTLGGADEGSFDIDSTTGQIDVGEDAELDYETKKTHTVTVTATDPSQASATITVTIMVVGADEAPEIVGENVEKDYTENGTGQVHRFTARDPEGRKVYWSLKQDEDTNSPDTGDFSISDSGVLTFNTPPDFDAPADDGDENTYVVSVVASDDAPGADRTAGEASGMVSEKKVTVTVKDVDERGELTVSSRYPQASVSLTATLSDDDLDDTERTTITWKWYATRSGGTPISGEITETHTPAAAGQMRVTATYDDGNGEKTLTKVVSVRAVPTDANSTTITFPADIEREVVENLRAGTNVGPPITATDPDSADSGKLTYTLTTDGSGNFAIDWATGQLKTTQPLDAEAGDLSDGAYTVTVTATDPWGVASNPAATVTITVKDVNEAPTVNLGATRITQMEHDEDLVDTPFDLAVAIGTYGAMDPESVAGACVAASCTWSLKGPDSGDFVIGNVGSEPDFAFGALRFKEAPNYEMPADANGDNMYEVTVVVTDAGVDGKNKMTAERGVVIEVTNVDEDGTVTLSSDHPKVDIELTATLTEDIDGGVTDLTWQWYDGTIEPNDLTSAAIEDATSATYTPAVGDLEDTLTARAAYTDAEGEGKSATMAATMVVIENLDNRPPEFEDADTGTTRYVIETAMEGALVRLNADGTTLGDTGDDPVTATDPNEDGDTSLLAYTLGGADEGSFDIDSTTGQIDVGEDAELDYETKKTHTVTVTATDPSQASATITVTIMVVGVDEPPVISVGGLAVSGRSSIDYNENGMGMVETYTATGPNAAMATWSLSGDDAGDFRISSDGILSFRSAPDYEMPMGGENGDSNIYMVTVNADDGTYMSMRDVTVRVRDVDEAIVGDTLLAKYDSNPQNGRIDRDEVLDGIEAFFLNISPKLREEVLDLIERFFADLGS